MTYNKVLKASFIDRPNRFIAHVSLNGREETVHVKNTGRCRELLIPGCTVYLEEPENKNRKTKYDLIAVEKKCSNGKTLLINMDSQAPNKVAAEWIKSNKKRFPNITFFKSECTKDESRFDFYFEYNDKNDSPKKMFLEVKGCTLEKDGEALFPDAPTERGVKHLKELTRLVKTTDYECGVLILIQMKGCHVFKPNWETHQAFGDALREAEKAGVEIFVMDSIVTPDSLIADKPVSFDLEKNI